VIVAVCVDDRMGMLFHNRRQSRDKLVCADLLHMAAGGRLCVTPYTAKLFDPAVPLCVHETPAECAETADVCFLEDPALLPPPDVIDTLLCYRWNRAYPFDAVFPLSLEGWVLTETLEFPGSSHERITKEVYHRA